MICTVDVICTVDGCLRTARAKGLCQKHYRQLPGERARRNADERKRVASLTGERLARYRSGQRARWRKRNTGWRAEDVAIALRQQNGRCAICDVVLVLSGNRVPASLTADHDHETGRTRGLLCRMCNVLAGWHLIVSVDEEEWGRRVKEYRARYK